MGEGDTLFNAVIGAVVTIVLSFVPFSPVLGGAAAGYLQRGSRRDGLRVGAYSGIVASIPLVLLLLLVGSAFAALPVFGGGDELFVGVAGVLVVVMVVGFVLVYGVALSALGGWAGNYVVTDTDL